LAKLYITSKKCVYAKFGYRHKAGQCIGYKGK